MYNFIFNVLTLIVNTAGENFQTTTSHVPARVKYEIVIHGQILVVCLLFSTGFSADTRSTYYASSITDFKHLVPAQRRLAQDLVTLDFFS